MQNLFPFSIGEVIKRLNRINITINIKYCKPFPKSQDRLLSYYIYKKRFVEITPSGDIIGGLPAFITSSIDFSFIRAICASVYSSQGGHAYDPTSLFLCELFCYLDKFSDMASFISILRDPEKGRYYRSWAGINDDAYIPSKSTFSEFKQRLGSGSYNAIFHVLVEIMRLLGIVSCKIISIDGTLFYSNSRYHGCTWFCEDCNNMEFKGLIENIRRRILYRLANLSKISLDKDIRIRLECPSSKFPQDVKKPKVDVMRLSLLPADPERDCLFHRLIGLEKELSELGLDVIAKKNRLNNINNSTDSFFFSCHKLPSDTDAKIGVRRNPKNPDNVQKIFGYNSIFATSIELPLGIEIPVACITISGNSEEGNQFIPIKQQISSHHEVCTAIDIADAKHDEHHNYQYSRATGSIPIIDYNPRSEKLFIDILKARGYDRNGWPFAPCGILTRPNGFDYSTKRASFSCRRQCLISRGPKLRDFAQSCPYWINYNGFSKHMSVHEYPRLITEIIRGTPRYQKIRALRPASERLNSTSKEDFNILSKPKVRGLAKASVLSQMAAIVILLKRVASFIVRVTLKVRKYIKAHGYQNYPFIPGPKVPKFIMNLVQRK